MDSFDEGFQFDREKFLAAVHYVCARQPPAALGRFKLHKALHLAELLRFLQIGQPLCGAEYVRQETGPLARQLAGAVDELERSGLLKMVERSVAGYPKQDFISLAPPATVVLSAEERHVLDQASDLVCGRGAVELSELRYEATFEHVAHGQPVPFYMAYSLVPCEVTDADVQWASQEYERLKLADALT